MSDIENNHSSNTEVSDIGVKSYLGNDKDREKFEFFFLKTYNHMNLSSKRIYLILMKGVDNHLMRREGKY